MLVTISVSLKCVNEIVEIVQKFLGSPGEALSPASEQSGLNPWSRSEEVHRN